MDLNTLNLIEVAVNGIIGDFASGVVFMMGSSGLKIVVEAVKRKDGNYKEKV